MIRLIVTYSGFSDAQDDAAERAAGCPSVGSGYGMGERDLEFQFTTRRTAERARVRVSKLAGYDARIDDDR
jgi:hypothetical protein